MVFGNKGHDSCSGVAFSRDEVTGEPTPSGDFLPNAQGEDVVSGVRTPHDLSELEESMPEAHAQLMEILRTLEEHYKDMQDTEFTADRAVEAAESGREVILVRPFTEADDVAGFQAARGILTSEGGKASHAALVARGMGKPCVAGASALDIDLHAKELRVNGTLLHEGDRIAIDGTAGGGTGDDG